ncbi:MAG: EAL domain-containing protein [Sedimenticola sp.]
MMKWGKSVLTQYLLLLATALVVLIFIQTRSIDVEMHNRRIDLLLNVKQTEGKLDRNVILTGSLQLTQYDPFVETQTRLDKLLQELESDDLILADDSSVKFSSHFSEYRKSLETKLQLIERIKSHAALLRNGLHYLPLAVESLRQDNPEMEGRLSRLLNKLYLYKLFPGVLETRDINSDIDEIEAFTEEGSDNIKKLENVLFHMRASLMRIKDLQALHDNYMAVPSQTWLEKLQQAYNTHYANQTRYSETYSRILLAFTVILLISLGITMRRLTRARKQSEQAWNQLRDAVESLSESFALFAPDGRLILNNSRYLELYPWLEEIIKPGVTLDEILLANTQSGEIIERVDASGNPYPDKSQLPCDERRTYIEQLKDGRWYLASDSCTSAGELASVRIDITESKRSEQQLRKLYRALEQSPASVVITDTSGNIEYVNPKFEETTGYTAKEALGQNPRLLKSGDKSPEEYKEMWETITAGKVWRGQFHNKRKDGIIYWEAASISPVRDTNGTITHYIAVKEDITARKRAEDQLRMNATVFETTTEAIMVTDADNHIKTVNPSFTRITGYELEEVIGRDPRILGSGRHDEAFYKTMWHSLRVKGYWNGELWNRKKDGSIYPEWLSLAAIHDDKGDIQEYIAVFSDITRRKQDEEQIRHQANYDALTGLPNRSLLVDRLANSLKSAHRENWRVALLFVDLDRFKSINDSLGHVAGDKLLQLVAERLLDCVREADTVSRFGGDEFVLILEDIRQASDAAEIAKKILTTLERPFDLNGRDAFIGASIGVTLYPDDSSDADTMLRNADMAMYRAKDAGRNTYQFFTLAMNERVQQQIKLEHDMRLALERDELLLHYQPIVRIADLRVIGVEALLRWPHPEQGYISPNQFIPLAEESGLIAPIGRWVLETACCQAAAWQQNGLDLKVNVNLSSRQLILGLEVDEIKQILDEAGLNPSELNLEITESLMMEGTDSTLEWLEEVRALGVELSIDDFGTGYSSLSYLKRFPMNTLKIDREFVRGLPNNYEDASLVQAIIAMAKSLNLKVVAEGVETEEQLKFIREKGCELVQGFLFSKPLPADEIPNVVTSPLVLKEDL